MSRLSGRAFHPATAEQVIAVAEAVWAKNGADADFVSVFCDLPKQQTEEALGLAADIGLVTVTAGTFKPASPITRFTSSHEETRKAAILRVMLESYEPFSVFRERLIATNSAEKAAEQTKGLLLLTTHREQIKDTLISLGTYSNALRAEGGGRYTCADLNLADPIMQLAAACKDVSQAEQLIRKRLGAAAEKVSRTDVVLPIANALLKASANKAADAVQDAGNAVESYLAELATRMNVDLTGASGISQKLDMFRRNDNLPKKVVEAAKYLGQIRNAADHGIDNDVGSAWQIQECTALQYVFVACSFIKACTSREQNGPFLI